MFFNRPTLITLTGPSASGKSYLLEAMVSKLNMARIVSTTDRAPRVFEIEGHHYNFITTEQSRALEAQGKFAELVTFNGTRYGVTEEEMVRKMWGEAPPIVIVEPKGVQAYREYCAKHDYGIFTVFVSTPDSIRMSRLSNRTVNELAEVSTREDVEKIIDRNNSRLIAAVTEERSWRQSNIWDLQCDGTDVFRAIDAIQHGINNRNSRSAVYA